MSIVLTGDTHGDMSIRKLNNAAVKHYCDGSFPSHAIILGDFGIVWSGVPSNDELYWIKWLDDKPWTTLVTLGNHENYERIYKLPLVDLYGGKAYKLSKKVYILQHGHVFTIEDRTFFNFGGGLSIDKAYRQNRLSWWEEEIPTYADFIRGTESLQAVGYNVDYVISHTAPQEAINQFQSALPFNHTDETFDLKSKDPTVQMLDAFINEGLQFKSWYFGHFHIDRTFNIGTHNYHAKYDMLESV